MNEAPLTLDLFRKLVACAKESCIPTTENGEYLVRLHESRLREAFELRLAPFSLVDGSPWIESFLPAAV